MSETSSRLPLVIYDDGLGDFGPLGDLCAAFDLRTGARTNRQRIEASVRTQAEALFVPEHLGALQRERDPALLINTLPDDADTLLVANGRWLGYAELGEDEEGIFLDEGRCDRDGTPTLAMLSRETAEAWAADEFDLGFNLSCVEQEAPVIDRPWQILDHLDATLAEDLRGLPCEPATALPMGVTRVGEHPIYLAPGATVHPNVHLDTTHGPIALEANATVLPFTVVEGPCWLGPDSVVAPHTSLRAGCVVGRASKVGGEVKASILGDFTNKAHFGYLGNAVVGRWCNLGAGTTASNLKNTWGEVRVALRPGEDAQPTGRTFLGPVIGDFVRTAIDTKLPTGAAVGTASCLVASSFAPKTIDAMAFLTDNGTEAMKLDALMRTLERMMARRGQSPSEALRDRLADLGNPTVAKAPR